MRQRRRRTANAKTRSSSCAPENIFLSVVVVVVEVTSVIQDFLICIQPNYKLRLGPVHGAYHREVFNDEITFSVAD